MAGKITITRELVDDIMVEPISALLLNLNVFERVMHPRNVGTRVKPRPLVNETIAFPGNKNQRSL